MSKTFNIRVYGLCIQDDLLLVTDEFRFGRVITKFPGGGLEFGEGTIECLKREIKEELELKVKVLAHFYTTDFFQPSAFSTTDQVISIYYKIALPEVPEKLVASSVNELQRQEGAQVFRWVELKKLKEEIMTFPIDRVVVKKLLT